MIFIGYSNQDRYDIVEPMVFVSKIVHLVDFLLSENYEMI